MKSKFILFFLLLSFQYDVLYAAPFKIERWKTTKGAQVVFYQAMEVPMLTINIAFAAGSAYDGPHFGLSSLTTDLLDQGAGNYDATQLAEKIADTGAQYNAEATRDMIVMQLKTLTKEEALTSATEALAAIINKPLFKQDAFNREKSRQLIAIAQQQESPDEVANIAFFNKLYGNHPYAHPTLGTEQTVKAINLNQVRDFYRRYFTNQNATVVLVGAIDTEKAHKLAEQLTSGLPGGAPALTLPKAPPLNAQEKVTINYPSSQTIIRLGQIGIDHANPNYFPIMVGNYTLGGGVLVSRLANEVREKRGLTYGVVSQFIPMPGLGPFVINLSTVNDQASTALKVTEDVLTDFLKTGPTEEELAAAKQYMIGSFPLSLASNSNIASMLLRIAFYKLPDDYLDNYTAHIDAVTTKDIKQAFDDILKPNKMLVVSVGKA
ncbi:zinc protease (peptidase, M16 family) [Legionella beliardensis]|uniref:Zinc protease (Peptidase, M16 family) n=2 Tax=Legionella beliardensis TaxID=91822 RepID=A0A378I3T5_9GAMM|nr:pitrilysin family protein [Legionella beliardensis]STX29838.1 zinc protease (peptidase, M16 family) [Legionella beliardensis]